jgi:hypothetical protein
MLHTADPHVRFARLKGLYRCELPSGKVHDVAFTKTMRTSKWKPTSPIKDSTIVTESGMRLFDMHSLVRGALLVNTDLRSSSGGTGKDFFVLEIDEDMLLRLLGL